MRWFGLWALFAGFGAWLRWVYAAPMAEKMWENSQAVGGGQLALDKIQRLENFVELAGMALIVFAVFMSIVQYRRLRQRSELATESEEGTS